MSAATEFIFREARVLTVQDGCKLLGGKEISYTDLVVQVAETNATGERVKESTVQLEAWGRAADAAASLSPGDVVTLTGRVRGSSYTSDKTGKTIHRAHLTLGLPVVLISEGQDAAAQQAEQGRQRPAYGQGNGGGYRGGNYSSNGGRYQQGATKQNTMEDHDIDF